MAQQGSPVTDHALYGCLLKSIRAHEHFEALNAEITAFLNRDPYRAVVEFDAQQREYLIRGTVERNPPPILSILIGDCLYELRSMLDHLAWQLAIVHSGTPHPRTEFPIFLDRDKYLECRRNGTPAPGSGLFKIQSLSPTAQALIERLQPYNRGDGPKSLHALWVLHKLSNEDKHRALHVTGAVLQDSSFEVAVPRGTVTNRFEVIEGTFEDRAIIGRLGVTFPHGAFDNGRGIRLAVRL